MISTCQFVDNDSRLNFYKTDAPVHSWYTSCPDPADEESGPILSNSAWIDNEKDGIVQEFEVGMPYYGIHTYSASVDSQSTAMCQKTYFALAMSKTLNENGQPGRTSPTQFSFVQADREHRDNVSGLPCSPKRDNADLDRCICCARAIPFVCTFLLSQYTPRQGANKAFNVESISTPGRVQAMPKLAGHTGCNFPWWHTHCGCRLGSCPGLVARPSSARSGRVTAVLSAA